MVEFTPENNLVIISNYPNLEEIKDGMMQRVANIDEYMTDKKRIYLGVSFNKNLFRKTKSIKDNLVEYRVNAFIDYFFIAKVLSGSKTIYVHSIYGFIKLLPFIVFVKNKNIVLDFHGVVPEELEFINKKFKFFIYNIVEKFAIKYSKDIIFVTKSMKDHVKKKYRLSGFRSYVLNIFSNNVFNVVGLNELELLRIKYNIDKKDVVFIYSGNAQKWQNIDLMLSCIDKIKDVENYKFIILTGEIELLKNKLKNFGLLGRNNIILDSVLPEELASFYSIAHYGFVLRDEHVLNSVANPTKLVEYMWYGIIPIVKFEDLGDYKALGYEYIKYENINAKMSKIKSEKNSEIIKSIQAENFRMEIIIND